jgi:hypothetical protein
MAPKRLGVALAIDRHEDRSLAIIIIFNFKNKWLRWKWSTVYWLRLEIGLPLRSWELGVASRSLKTSNPLPTKQLMGCTPQGVAGWVPNPHNFFWGGRVILSFVKERVTGVILVRFFFFFFFLRFFFRYFFFLG